MSLDRSTTAPVYDPILHKRCTANRYTPAGLRTWPISEIERGMHLSDQQRIALYELAASSLRAAEKLSASCPHGEALTPVRRMALLRASLSAVLDAIAAIEPTLTRFYQALDEGQRVRIAGMH